MVRRGALLMPVTSISPSDRSAADNQARIVGEVIGFVDPHTLAVRATFSCAMDFRCRALSKET